MNNQRLFRVEDVNSIIKLFAFSIQERFQQIDGIPKNQDQNRYLPTQSIEDSQHLIRKYRNYLTHQQKQIKFLQKLVVRIMQILQFFKQRSKNQQVLILLIKNVQDKLNKIVKSVPVDVQWLYSCIIDLAKNGFHIRKTNVRERRYSLKKIQVSQHKFSQILYKSKKEEIKEQTIEKRAISTATNMGRQRRQISLSAKKMSKQISKESLETNIAKMYQIIDVDLIHLQKIADTKDRSKIQKESMKQNTQNLAIISLYEKNHYFFSKKKQKSSDTILAEVNNRTSVRPILNNWISRKRKINQCKRKIIDSQNVSIL